jgi:hypothetical protein
MKLLPILYILCSLFTAGQPLHAQQKRPVASSKAPAVTAEKKVDQEKWVNTPVVHIDFTDNHAYGTVEVEKDGSLKLDKLPEKIIIVIPSGKYEVLKTMFNKPGSAEYFELAKNCKTTDHCEPIELGDLVAGKVELFFHKGELVRIGNRPITPRRINTTHLAIRVSSAPADGQGQAPDASGLSGKPFPATRVVQQTVAPIDKSDLDAMVKCILCNNAIEPCNDKDGKTGNSITGGRRSRRDKKGEEVVYSATYDVKTGAIKWYRQDVNGLKTVVTDISNIRPYAGSEMTVEIKGIDSVKYILTADGELFFMDDGEKLAKVNEDIVSAFSKAADTGTATPVTTQTITDSLEMVRTDSAHFLLQADPLPLSWKTRLLALDKVLEHFNFLFSNIDFRAQEYLQQLAGIRQGIKNCLNIPVTDDPADLKKALINIVSANIDSAYYAEFALLINSIEGEYAKALDKRSNRTLFVKTIQVPDADRIKIGLGAVNSTEKFFERSFNVRGGFKIDFSSGIFFTGLGNPEYVLSKSFFQYRETKDTVVVRNGLPVDSIMYSGQVSEVSGDFIRENKRRLTYGAGFFAHGYWRKGRPLNVGVAAGLVLNNTGQVLGMFGGSAMLNAGKQRIALLGGVAIGRVRTLSGSAEPYRYKDEYVKYENGQTVYNHQREVPRFFDTSNSNEIPTYEKWKVSYFFGLSFNFASVSVGQKTN